MNHKSLFFPLFLCFARGVSSDELKMVSVMEGDSVTLQTDLTELQTDEDILWLFGPKSTRIAKITKDSNSSSMSYPDDGRFRDNLKLDSQTGSLTITNITDTNSGLYNVHIYKNKETSYKRFNVTVYAHLSVPDISRNSSNCSSKCELVCSVMNVTHATLSWYKGNSLLSSISESDLSIRLSLPLEVEYQDTNTYSCVLNNPITRQTQHLNIPELCGSCSKPRNLITLLWVGIAILLILVTVVFVVKCRHKISRQASNEDKR